MIRILLFALLLLASTGLLAQVQHDSTVVQKKYAKADSLTNHYLQAAERFSSKGKSNKVKQKTDSLKQRVLSGAWLKSRRKQTDSITVKDLAQGSIPVDTMPKQVISVQHKLDSTKSTLSLLHLSGRNRGKLDSLKSAKLGSDTSSFSKKKASLDSLKENYAFRLDSIQQRIKDPLKLQQKKDSLTQAYNGAVASKLKKIQDKGLGLTSEEKSFLHQSGMPNVGLNAPLLPAFNMPTSSIPDVALNAPDLSLPQVSLPEASIPTTISPDIKIPTLDKVGLPEMPMGEQLTKVKNISSEAQVVGSKVGDYAKDVKEIKDEGLEKSQNLDKLVDEGVQNIDQVEAVQKELAGAEKLKQLQQLELDKIKNAQELRDQASSAVVNAKVLSNETLVKEQVEKMNKHKKKFDHIQDMRNIPKFKPNSMKGKTIIERLEPGVLFQFLKEKEKTNWFIAPELLYKLSGTFAAGAAGLYSFQYTSAPKIVWTDPVYGYKFIVQAKAYKSFYVRAEWESTSRMISSTSQLNNWEQREWNKNYLAGLGRVQKISPRLNGYFWGFYNFTRDPKDLFTNKVILKTGIQFKLVDEHKKTRKHISDKIKRLSEDSRRSMNDTEPRK
ncbi:MAG: hypothetical protein EBR30_13135 [Cytophagia bacterium]|nr:hypothetical protein [Cytophagia bacterium]